MPSMRAVLERRQKAAAVRVEELEAELERVREALAETDAPAVVADGVSRRKPVGPRRAGPHRDNAPGTEVLSVDYQVLMAAAVEAGADGLGARRAAVVLGWDSASVSRVEGARARLKRLVERGWLAEVRPGRFTLPGSGTGLCRRAARRRLMRVVIDHRMTASLVSVRRS